MHYLEAAAYGYKYKDTLVDWKFRAAVGYPIYEAVLERDFVKAQKALEKQMPVCGACLESS